MASSTQSATSWEYRDSSRLTTPSDPQPASSVRRGTVAARIRAFQDQNQDVASPAQSPLSRDTPKRINPQALKFLASAQLSPGSQQSPVARSKLAPSPTQWVIHQGAGQPPNYDKTPTGNPEETPTSSGASSGMANTIGKSEQQSLLTRRPISTRQKTVKASFVWEPAETKAKSQAGANPEVDDAEECDLGDHYVSTAGKQTAANFVPSNGEQQQRRADGSLAQDVQDVWKRSAENSSDSAGGSSQQTATAEQPTKQEYPQLEEQRRHSWFERSMMPEDCTDRHKEDYATFPPRPFWLRPLPPPVQAPQPLTRSHATFLGKESKSEEICLDDEHSKNSHHKGTNSRSQGRGIDGHQEPKNNDAKQTPLSSYKSSQHQESPATGIIRSTRVPRPQVNSQTFTQLPDDRFDVFVRERADDVVLGPPRKPANAEVVSAPEKRLTQASPSPAGEQSSQAVQAKPSRGWRWWKLVLNEKEAATPGSSAATEISNEASTQRVHYESDSGSSVGSPQSGHEIRLDSFSQTPDDHSRRASFQPADLRAIPDTVESLPPVKALDGLRVQDAFGNGILLDEQELPTEAIERLSALESPSQATERSPRGRLRHKRGLMDQHQRADKFQVPIEAIAPIVQNDGTASQYQNMFTEPKTEPRTRNASIRKSIIPEVAENLSRQSSKEFFQEGCKIALNNEGRKLIVDVTEEEDVLGRGKKIVVKLEDGAQKLMRVEVFPGKKFTVVVQREKEHV